MTHQECLSHETLARFDAGRLASDDAETLVAHLENCQRCQNTLADLGDRDMLAPQLREAKHDYQFRHEAGYLRAEALVRKVGDGPSVLRPDKLPVETRSGGAPSEFGQYQLLERLGEGGMGAVYKAFHSRLSKVVAIKVLRSDRLNDPQAVARFEREMAAVGRLEHPHIVRATDAGEIDGTHFLVMEFVAGNDLAEVSRRCGPLPLAEACELVRQAALGLDEAHAHGVVHRDIKPSNLMLCAARRRKLPMVKLLDLGLALLSGSHSTDQQELTNSTDVMGTLDYMAPEQIDNSHDVDARADIYGLGATLYRLLLGKSLYDDEQLRSPYQKMKAIVAQPIPSIRTCREDVPEPLAALIQQMLAKDPRERVGTADAVIDRLTPYCQGADLTKLPLDAGTGNSPTTDDLPSAVDPNSHPLGSGTDAKATTVAALDAPPSPPAKSLLRFLAVALTGIVLLTIVLLLPGRHGTLRIEIQDPSIEVTVSGDARYRIKGKSGDFEVAAGQHNLHVTAGGTTFQTKEFTLAKGEEVSLRVTFLEGTKVQVLDGDTVLSEHALPKPDVAGTFPEMTKATSIPAVTKPAPVENEPLPPADTAEDRAVAEWFFQNMAGQLDIRTQAGTAKTATGILLSDGKVARGARGGDVIQTDERFVIVGIHTERRDSELPEAEAR